MKDRVRSALLEAIAAAAKAGDTDGVSALLAAIEALSHPAPEQQATLAWRSPPPKQPKRPKRSPQTQPLVPSAALNGHSHAFADGSISIQDLAVEMGLHPTTLYGLVREGKLPVLKQTPVASSRSRVLRKQYTLPDTPDTRALVQKLTSSFGVHRNAVCPICKNSYTVQGLPLHLAHRCLPAEGKVHTPNDLRAWFKQHPELGVAVLKATLRHLWPLGTGAAVVAKGAQA